MKMQHPVSRKSHKMTSEAAKRRASEKKSDEGSQPATPAD